MACLHPPAVQPLALPAKFPETLPPRLLPAVASNATLLFLSLAALLLLTAPPLRAQFTVDTAHSLRLVNANSHLPLNIANGSLAAGTAAIQGGPGEATHWHFVPQGNSQYLIVSLETRAVLGISSASLADQTPAVQWSDNSTPDHLWTIEDAGNGSIQIRNVNSGLLLGVTGQSLEPGAAVIQEASGGIDTLWTVRAGKPAYPPPLAAEVAYSAGDSATIHDPSMIRTEAGKYYLYSTHSGIRMHESGDMRTFADVGTAFPTVPAWTSAYTNGSPDLWAPDVSYRDGKYWMYYAASSFGSNNSAIGVATSPSGAPGSWNDSGTPVITLSDCVYANPIDPGLVVDDAGNPWLTFGSFYGDIYMFPLDRTTGHLAPNNGCSFLSRRYDTQEEGSYVFHRGKYYYLFVSFGVCCQGVNSTYHIAVGRATSVTGPYLDEAGLPMTNGGGTILLSTHSNIVGPGGETVLALPRGDLLVYHYYDGNNGGTSTLGMNWLGWRDGWPILREDAPE